MDDICDFYEDPPDFWNSLSRDSGYGINYWISQEDKHMNIDKTTLEKLDHLAMDLVIAKSYEEKARRDRVAIEEKIAELVPTEVPGQRTIDLGGKTKVVVRRELSYKANIEAVEKLFSSEGISRSTPIKTKITKELDVAGYEWYKSNDPASFALLSQHVEVTPRKVSVSLK